MLSFFQFYVFTMQLAHCRYLITEITAIETVELNCTENNPQHLITDRNEHSPFVADQSLTINVNSMLLQKPLKAHLITKKKCDWEHTYTVKWTEIDAQSTRTGCTIRVACTNLYKNLRLFYFVVPHELSTHSHTYAARTQNINFDSHSESVTIHEDLFGFSCLFFFA